MKSLKKLLLQIFATRFFQPFFEKLHYIALKGMNYGSANSPEDSGEEAVIKMLQKELQVSPVLFDVGANNGQYLEMLLRVLKDKKPIIHSFEPDAKAYGKLKLKFGHFENVFLNNFALGEKNHTSVLYVSKDGGVDSSLIKSTENEFLEYQIEVKTLDDYCNDNNILKIDFLKIDTEGFEMSVLKGASKMIDKDAIKQLQLEHGSIHSIMAGSSLFQYKKLLSNFRMYHIKQDGAYPLKYSPKNEIYYNSNYFFKLK